MLGPRSHLVKKTLQSRRRHRSNGARQISEQKRNVSVTGLLKTKLTWVVSELAVCVCVCLSSLSFFGGGVCVFGLVIYV